MAGEVGFEPTHDGIKIRCLNQLGHSPIKCPCDQLAGIRMTRLQPREPGSYLTDLSLPVPDIRRFVHVRKTVKIRPRSTNVYVEPVFQYRTPRSETLLGACRT